MEVFESVYAVVLAAGKGTRMKSDMAKVLHHVFFEPMINHVLAALAGLPLAKTVIITGHQAERVEQTLAPFNVTFARQGEQLGTGHAVLAAEKELAGVNGTALILCGDTPLIEQETLAAMIDAHQNSNNALTVMTTFLKNPTNYGRVFVNESGLVEKIIEEKDASDQERMIKQVNAGVYCVDLSFLFSALKRIGTDNKQGEVYLTDIVAIANADGISAGAFVCEDSEQIIGVNSRVELAKATGIMQKKRNNDLMAEGVTMVDPDSVFIEKSVQVGSDTIIYPNCHLAGATIVGKGCILEPFVKLENSSVGDGGVVPSFSHMYDKVLQ